MTENNLPEGVSIESFELPTPEPPTDWAIGQLVLVKPGYFGKAVPTDRAFRIIKRPARSNEVNYKAEPADGVGQGLRGPAYCFTAYDGPAPEKAVGCPVPGTIVHCTGLRGVTPEDLLVVLHQSVDGTSGRLTRVNGDGRYWSNIHGTRMTPVEVVKA